MRRWLPDSLAAWTLIILIGGLGAAELATLGAIAQHRVIATRMTGFFHLAERVSSISRAIATEPPELRATLATALSTPTLSVRVATQPDATSIGPEDDEIAEIEDIMQARLAGTGIDEVDVGRQEAGAMVHDDPAADQATGPVGRFLTEIADLYDQNDAYLVSARLGDGSWVNFTIPMAPLPRLWAADTIALTAAAIAIVLAASIWALRRLTAPYAVLADAAARFGRDRNAVTLPEVGPREVRIAARAFNLMQTRLQRFLADRDLMVAAVSHDLRTPVTRLRLRAEFVEDTDQRARMLADLDDIETMTRSVLTFARGSTGSERREIVDVVSLLESLCSDLPGVTLDLPGSLPARIALVAQPVELRRGISNLIENAVKYGGGATVTLDIAASDARIVVEDRGPGIPDEHKEGVFQPFFRLESSRNRETGGTGLGLTIARTVARAHGGEIELTDRPGGGLRATLILPVSASSKGAAAELRSADCGTSMPRSAA